MNAVRARAAAVLLLCALALFAAHAWRPTDRLADARPKFELEALFPKQFGDWSVDERMPVQLVSPDVQAVLSAIYNQTLSRSYVNAGGQRIMLSVAYGGDQSDATRAHRPEVCYPAQGFQIVSGASSAIASGGQTLPVRKLVARQGGRNEPITYWMTVGDRVTLTGTQQKLAQLSYTTRGVIPDGMLVRVSSIGRDEGAEFAAQQAFVTQLRAAIAPAQRAHVFGGPDD